MKKLRFGFMVVFVLLLALTPALEASAASGGEDVYGPKIKGLQLGMRMTLSEMINKALALIGNYEEIDLTAVIIRSKDSKLGSAYALQAQAQGGKFLFDDFSSLDPKNSTKFELSNDFPKEFYPKDAASMDNIVTKASIEARDFKKYLRTHLVLHIDGNRLISFTVGRRVFDAETMQSDTFIQSLKNAYSLPELHGITEPGYNLYAHKGENRAEGWEVKINPVIYGIHVTKLDESLSSSSSGTGAGSFN